MEVSGQFHAPVALSPGEVPPVATEYGAGWAAELVWTLWNREKSAPTRNRNLAVQTVAHRYAHLAIPAPNVSRKHEFSTIIQFTK
jgi:hypothetical protein